MAFAAVLKEEFKCRSFGLGSVSRNAFLQSQWDCTDAFIIYRTIVAAYTLFVLIYNFATSAYDYEGRFVLIYLTVLTYTLLAGYLTLSAIIVITGRALAMRSGTCTVSPGIRGTDRFFFVSPAAAEQGLPPKLPSISGGDGGAGGGGGGCCGTSGGADRIPWYMQLNWLLFEILIAVSPIVSVIYFVALPRQPHSTTMQVLVDYSMHATNSAIVGLELCLSAIPVRIMHFVYPMAYAAAYVVFNTIFWTFDRQKNVIYPKVLDWNYPESTIIVVLGVALLLPVLQFLLFLVYRLRVALFAAAACSRGSSKVNADAFALSANRFA